jgi:single-strand DNA-binding protein
VNNNFVTMIGNLTREPQFRIAGSVPSVTMGFAVNRRWKTRENTFAEATSFYNVVVWGPMSNNITSSLHKGDRVVVVGRMETREWTDDDGKRHQVVELIADEIAASLRFGSASLSRRRRAEEEASALPSDSGVDDRSDDGVESQGDPGWRPDDLYFSGSTGDEVTVGSPGVLNEPALV